jgi:hypothetical protein
MSDDFTPQKPFDLVDGSGVQEEAWEDDALKHSSDFPLG